jgi:hypothetical protein
LEALVNYHALMEHPSMTPITVDDLLDLVSRGHTDATEQEREHRRRDHVQGLRVRPATMRHDDPRPPLILVGAWGDRYLVGRAAMSPEQRSCCYQALGSDLHVDLRSLEARVRVSTACHWLLYADYDVTAFGLTWGAPRQGAGFVVYRELLRQLTDKNGLEAAIILTALANALLGRCELNDVVQIGQTDVETLEAIETFEAVLQ